MNTLGVNLTIKGSDEVEKQVASELKLPDPVGSSMATIVKGDEDEETPKTDAEPT